MKNSIFILISIFLFSSTYSQSSLKTKKASKVSHKKELSSKGSTLKSKKANAIRKNKISYSHTQPATVPTFSNEPFVGEPCASGYLDEYLKRTDLVYRQNRIAIESQLQQFTSNRSGSSRGVVYTIPVVFHVMHSGELIGDSTNISLAQIQSTIAALNRDFRRDSTLDGGIANSGPLGIDAEIEFCMAQKDPNGLYSSGVTRHDMSGNQSYLDSGVYHNASLWRSDVSMKTMVQWNPSQYLNVWVVNKIKNKKNIYSTGYTGGVIGYATFPGTATSSDGIVILSSATGNDPTGILNYNLASYTDDGRILTHEVGHYLNLYHTFSGTSTCTPGTPCATSGDLCCDTPPTTVGMGNNCTSPVCALANLENYMDYQNGACTSDFTPNQVTRMRAVLASGGARHALTQTNNCTPPLPPLTAYSLNLNAIDYTSLYFGSTPYYGYTNPIFPDSNVLIGWTGGAQPPWLHAVCQTFDLSGGYLNSPGALFDPATRAYSINDTIKVDSITIRGYYGRPDVSTVDTAIIRIVAGNHGNYKRAFNASSVDSIISVVDDINRDNAGDSAIWTGKIILNSAFKNDSLSYGAHLFKIAPNLTMQNFDGLLGVTVEFKPGRSYSQANDTIFKNQNYINVVFSTPRGVGTSFPLGNSGNRERTSGSFSDDNTKYSAASSFNFFLPPIAFATDHSYQLYDVTLKISKDTNAVVSRDTINITPLCDSSLVNGNWYFTTQTLTDTVFKISGAIDSLKYTIITINQSTSSSITQISCNSYVSASGKTYTATGVYLDTITNAAGCDSLINLNLTIRQPNTGINVVNACDSYTWNGTTYTANNSTAKDTLTNAGGCDSVVTLNLTITNSTSSVFTHSTCGSYIWNGTTYTANNNTAKDTLVNGSGCDSIIALNLTILPAPNLAITQTLDTLKSNQNSATYQWIDCGNGKVYVPGATNQQFISANSGSYAVIVTLGSCFDTTSCKTVAKVGLNEIINSDVFTVYPNPTNGEFTISFKEYHNGTYKVAISNSLGQVINQFEASSQNQEVNLRGYSNGLYFITISSARENTTVRIVKQ